RYGVPGGPRAWGLLAGGIGAGVVLWWAARSPLDRFRARVDAVGGLIRDTAVAWTSPSVDTAAVLWVAVERFGWQGMTLWLPRRLLAVHAMGIAWFQDVVVPALGRIPLHALLLARWCAGRLASSPGMQVAVIVAVLALAWLR
ncbi:MAG: hypothetical protein MUE60_12655, partial [Candidatus Eisenbacteria bacterium]|nr:hypothetical protein [Candidatus Eisenbacteria bacterium]